MKKLTILATTMILLAPQFVLACPMCRDSVSSGGNPNEASSLPGGFNNSTYTLLSGLFFALGITIYNIVHAVKTTPVDVPTGPQSSRGFEVQPSDSSPDGTE